MTQTSSETCSEERGGAGADILDLDRYMRPPRPPRPAHRPSGNHKKLCDELVVDSGGVQRAASRDSDTATQSDSDSDPASGGSRHHTHKQLSHDSGLSDTSYRYKPYKRHQRGSKSVTQAAGRAVSRSSAGAGTGKQRGSESSHTFRAMLRRTLREQQEQIARVAQLCERQARERGGERPSERGDERPTSERGDERPSGRVSERRSKRPERPASASRRTSTGTPSDSTGLSSSTTSTRGPHKHRSTDCRTYKIIMSKLDELNRLFAARRAAGPAPSAPSPAALHRGSSGSVTVSDKVVGTDSPPHARRYGGAVKTTERGGECVVAYALSVDIPPKVNVVTESVVRYDEVGDEATPGGFALDDPVRLYQQAKRLESARPGRVGSSGCVHSSAHSSSRGSCKSSCKGSSKGSCKGSCNGTCKGSCKDSPPSLCTLCRCYWNILRRYVSAQLTALHE